MNSLGKINARSFHDAKGLLDGTLADMEAMLGGNRMAKGMLPSLLMQATVRIWREMGYDDVIVRQTVRHGLEVVIQDRPLSLDEVP